MWGRRGNKNRRKITVKYIIEIEKENRQKTKEREREREKWKEEIGRKGEREGVWGRRGSL